MPDNGYVHILKGLQDGLVDGANNSCLGIRRRLPAPDALWRPRKKSVGGRLELVFGKESLWICGRSALPTGCAFPASRASSEGGEMLAFAHIPTGTPVNRAIHIDAS